MRSIFFSIQANRKLAIGRYWLALMLSLLLPSAYAATAASIAHGSTLYATICSTCHGPNAADNVNRISAGAYNPTLIQSLININFGGMGVLKTQYQLTSTDITDAANYLGSVFQPGQGAAGFAASPSSISFGSRAVGSSGGGTTLSLSNTGTGTLNILGITSSSSDFVIASGCPASLAPAAVCFVTVTFAPKVAGPISGSLTIQTNTTPASTQLAVSGIGIGPYTGLWWNPNESGWGMSLTQQGVNIFLAWYTYDQSGAPIWYVMSACRVAGKGCGGDIYAVAGGTSMAVPWNGVAKLVTKVGTGSLAFTDNDNGVFTYSLNGANGVKNIARQVFAAGTAQPALDYTALWWNPNESGWGVALTQQFGMIFAALYTYDAAGAPIWYVASSCPVIGTGCSGDLYQVNGGFAPTSTWNGSKLAVAKIGTVSFAFADNSAGIMTYTINGAAGSRSIIRQSF
jgi:hypothetical protein